MSGLASAERRRGTGPRISSRFRPGDVALVAAFILLVILGYVALVGAVGGAFVDAGQVPFPGQYP